MCVFSEKLKHDETQFTFQHLLPHVGSDFKPGALNTTLLSLYLLNSPNIAQVWLGQQAIMGVLLVEVESIILHPLSISRSSWYGSDLEHNL